MVCRLYPESSDGKHVASHLMYAAVSNTLQFELDKTLCPNLMEKALVKGFRMTSLEGDMARVLEKEALPSPGSLGRNMLKDAKWY